MKTRVITLLRQYLYPICKYIFTEAYKEKFNIKTLTDKALENREYLENKLSNYTLEKAKLCIENFELTRKEMESVEGYAGTIEDEELLGGNGPTAYNGEVLKPIPFRNDAYDQLENKQDFGFTQCFLYGNMTNAKLNGVVDLNPEDRYSCSKESQKGPGYDIRYGGYFSEGIRITSEKATELGEEFDVKMISAQSKYVRTVLDYGYAVTIGIRLSQELLDGMRKDGILQNSEITGPTKYNHLVNFQKNKEGTIDMWVDNYSETRIVNTFEIEDIMFLAKSGKFMNTCTFFVPKGDTYNKNGIKGYEHIDSIDETKFDLKCIIKWLIAFANKDPIIQIDVKELSEKDRTHSAKASEIRNKK